MFDIYASLKYRIPLVLTVILFLLCLDLINGPFLNENKDINALPKDLKLRLRSTVIKGNIELFKTKKKEMVTFKLQLLYI